MLHNNKVTWNMECSSVLQINTETIFAELQSYSQNIWKYDLQRYFNNEWNNAFANKMQHHC